MYKASTAPLIVSISSEYSCLKKLSVEDVGSHRSGRLRAAITPNFELQLHSLRTTTATSLHIDRKDQPLFTMSGKNMVVERLDKPERLHEVLAKEDKIEDCLPCRVMGDFSP